MRRRREIIGKLGLRNISFGLKEIWRNSRLLGLDRKNTDKGRRSLAALTRLAPLTPLHHASLFLTRYSSSSTVTRTAVGIATIAPTMPPSAEPSSSATKIASAGR